MQRDSYKKYFSGKKVTVMGLGILGRGLQVTQFLVEAGAKVTVTDLKQKKDLKTSLDKLKKYKIKYTLEKHDLKDFENKDMVMKSAGVPLDSPYVAHAKKNGAGITMDASLFARIVRKKLPNVKIIGITGTRGKSMTTALIYHLLESNKKKLGVNVYLGGNMRMKATLPILDKIQDGDIVVLEIDSWQCQGFGDEKISPSISVFTNIMPDHMNYYKNSMKKYLLDKSYIYRFQKKNDFLVTTKEMLSKLPSKPQSKVKTSFDKIVLPKNIIGAHNLQNAKFANEVAKIFGLSQKEIRKSFDSFPGLEGRLEFVRKIKGVSIINDNNATTPEATIAGINAVLENYKQKPIIILGGSDKKIDLNSLPKTIKSKTKKVILLPGTGSEKLKKILKKDYSETTSLNGGLREALASSKPGDVVLFSPGFASFGMFKNEYDRNDQFLSIVKKWK